MTRIVRSLAELADEQQFVPSQVVLGVPVKGTPIDQPCDHCCHWWVPIFAMYARRNEPNLAFHYEEWLIWHLHCVQHQQLGAVVS